MLPVPGAYGIFFPSCFPSTGLNLAVFTGRGIPLWIPTLPAVLEETRNLFQHKLTGCGVRKQHEMRYLADDSELFFPLSLSCPFLFHLMFPYMHAAVLDLKLWACECPWAPLKGTKEIDYRKQVVAGRSKSTELCLCLKWKMARYL